LMRAQPSRSTLFPYTTLFRSRRVFGFPPAHPAFFWIEDPAPRLLFSLGPAPLVMLQLLANPALEHQRLWPLTTDRAQAVEAARADRKSTRLNSSHVKISYAVF